MMAGRKWLRSKVKEQQQLLGCMCKDRNEVLGLASAMCVGRVLFYWFL